MNHVILTDGNLEISADLNNPEDIDDLSNVAQIEDVIGSYFHEKLYIIPPEDIGALTQAPIVSDEMTIDDFSRHTPGKNLWWFIEYESTDPMQVLMETGKVIFTKV